MKYKYLCLLTSFILLLSFSGVSHGDYTETFTTGKDWSYRMSKREKFLAVFAPYILYHRYGIPFRKEPNAYILDIDRILVYNPYIENEDIANIFASTVYALEPESRPAFQAMARDLQYQNLSHREVVYPRLLLAPSAQDPQNTSFE